MSSTKQFKEPTIFGFQIILKRCNLHKFLEVKKKNHKGTNSCIIQKLKIKVKKDHKDITLLNKIFYEDETESEPYHQVSKIEKSFFVGKSMNLTNLL